MPKEFPRSDRIAQMINRHLAVILRNQVNDPRLNNLTITDVEVTKDLRQAKVFVTSLSNEGAAIEDTMDAIERANGFLRGRLARELDMRHCPNLLFAYDGSISEGVRMSALIDRALNSDR